MADEAQRESTFGRSSVPRRAVLGAVALGLGGGAVAVGRARPDAAAGHGGHAWKGSELRAVPAGVTVIDRDTELEGLHVPAGSAVVLAPDRDVTLTCRGNAVVEGLLELAPQDAGTTHRIVFEGVDETRFVGGGMAVLPDDVGLWVMGDGELRLTGHPRTAWTRASGSVRAGERVLELATAPSGWLPGDELVITATAAPSVDDHDELLEVAVIADVHGSTVTTTGAFEYDHPAVPVPGGPPRTAEVLNLTRNVRIEGTAAGRAHVLIMTTRPQHLSNATLRHMGPRNDGEGLVGRYGLHFHMCGNASRGSLVEGVVVRDCGSHAFVPHSSHGVSFRGCISHNTVDDAYWWDQGAGGLPGGPATDDTEYSACVASAVASDPPYRGFRLSGFNLGVGKGNSVTGCVATSVGGSKDASGFVWPEAAGDVWTFRDNVAHNNARHGLFTWQNNHEAHDVVSFVGYHNGGNGIGHGAYNNGYRYADSVLYANGGAGVFLHAVSTEERPIRLEGLTIDCAGLADYAIQTTLHTLPPDDATYVERCTLSGYHVAGIGLTYDGDDGPTEADRLDVVDCTFAANRFWFSDHVAADSLLRVQDGNRASAVRPMSAGIGSPVSEWNARVTPIPPFRP